MFLIKTGYYLKLLMPESMKVLGSTKSKITGENVSHFKITEVVLVHCNTANSKIQESYMHLLLINHLVNY